MRAQGASVAPGVTGRRSNPVDGTPANRPSDTVTFSPESLEAAAALPAEEAAAIEEGDAQQATAPGQSDLAGTTETTPAEQDGADEASQEANSENSAAPRGADGEPLSDAEVEQVRELSARDLEVRQHEQAHVAAGGPYVTSGPTYQYQQGPDGKRYAVGGSVGIDVSPEDTPEKTIAKAQVVRQAALAPAEPSAQDLRVASQATQLEQRARSELSEQRREEQKTEADETEEAESGPANEAAAPSENRAPEGAGDPSASQPAAGLAANPPAAARAFAPEKTAQPISQAAATNISAAAQLARSAYAQQATSPTFLVIA